MKRIVLPAPVSAAISSSDAVLMVNRPVLAGSTDPVRSSVPPVASTVPAFAIVPISVPVPMSNPPLATASVAADSTPLVVSVCAASTAI